MIAMKLSEFFGRPAGQAPATRHRNRTVARYEARTVARRLRRPATVLATGVAALATALSLSAAPAHAADNAYHPSDADFADCPALPADAVPGTWKCYAMTVLNGTVQLNTRGVHIDKPLRITVAQGRAGALGLPKAVFGGIRNGGPYPMIAGIAGTPFESPDPNGWQVQFYATPTIEPGLIVPSMFGLKARIIGSELSDTCYIGNELEPVTVRPQFQWALPGWIDGVMVAKVQADAIFGLPNALGCGGAAAMLKVNALMNLPAPATADHLVGHWAIRNKDY